MERNAEAAAGSGDKQDDAPLAEQQAPAVAVDPQSLAQLDELQKQLSAREELRTQNAVDVVDALRAQIAKGTLKLKSDIKKSSAFVKKLKVLTENNADSVMKDIVELNLTRYVSECVASIAEAPLKIVDLNAAVKVISLLHQRYEDFSALMVQTLVSVFDASYGTEDKTKIVKRRIILRLLSELYLAGVYGDANVIVAIIQRVARREGGAPNKQRGKGANASSAGGSGSSSAQLEVPLLVSFAKSVGVEFLGVRPKKFKDLEMQLGDKFVTLMEKVQNMVPHAMQREALACFSESYEMICKFYLTQHATFVKLEARNEREEANRGEVSDAHVQELENAKLLFEKLQTSVNSLADALDREVPPLPLNKDDDGNGGGLSVWEGDGSSRAMRADSPFDDEDTRSFYEDLPDLLVLVPAVVLGLTEADVAELKKKREATAAAPSAAEEEVEVEAEAAGDGDADETGGDEGDAAEENDDVDDRAQSESETALEGESKPPAQESSAAASASSTTASATGAAGYHHQHDSYFSSLEDLVNRDRCDKAAVDFCYRNSKANRSRLIKTLFSVPRTHLELLAYYARLVATLQSVFKEDIGGELVNMLVNEFTHHIKKRNQFRLESKIKNIRFLAELVKFKICPPNVGFRCLKKCFDDFQGHNVLVATTFLENCGRFLYYSKHTHVRTENFLSIMMKLKSAKNLDPQAETLVQNAYYMCKPPERVERAVKQYDPLYLFIMKCLYQDLNETNVNKVVKTLRKLPWLDKTTTGYMLKAIRKVTKGKVMHMKLICEVVKGLSRYHDELPILLIDDVLEIIRRGLQINDYRDHQHSLGVVKLLGELYNSALVNMNIVLETLYLIINHSHDLLTLPEYSGTSPSSIPATQLQETKRRFQLVPDMRFDPRVPSDVDGPTEVFRIRLVCALVDACNGSSATGSSATSVLTDRGISKARLSRFMVFFQRYIFSKTEIPLETDFVVIDLFEALAVSLKDHFKKFESWEEVDAAARVILRGDLEEAERRLAKKNAALAAANPNLTRESFSTADMEPLSRTGEEDEDEDDDDDESEDDDEDEEDENDGAQADDAEGEEDDEEDDEDDDDDDDDDEEDDDDDDEDDEEDEEEEEQLIIHDRVQKSEEDDVFEKAFKSMMQSTADTRKVATRVNVDKMAIPTVVKSAGPPVNPAAAASPFGANGPQGVVFRMLRRGNKGKVEARQLVVPEGSSLAQHSHRQENAGKKEMSELKRLVLQNVEREELFAETGLDAVVPGFSIPIRSSSSVPPPVPQPPRDLNRTGFGLSSEWNNDEFGLRRGRGYRGQK